MMVIVPLPKPSAENLPGDIESVKIDYVPGAVNEVGKTFKDTQSIQSLVNLVNSLPVAPDTLRSGPIIDILGLSIEQIWTLIVMENIKMDGVYVEPVEN